MLLYISWHQITLRQQVSILFYFNTSIQSISVSLPALACENMPTAPQWKNKKHRATPWTALDSWPINKLIPAKLSFTLGNSNLWTFIKPYHPIILLRALLSTSCDPSIYFWTDRVLLVSLKYLLSHTVSTWWFQLIAWVSNFSVLQVPPHAPKHWRKILHTPKTWEKDKNDRRKRDLCWLTFKNQKSGSFQDLVFNPFQRHYMQVCKYILVHNYFPLHPFLSPGETPPKWFQRVALLRHPPGSHVETADLQIPPVAPSDASREICIDD